MLLNVLVKKENMNISHKQQVSYSVGAQLLKET